jgi:hypothetical protein
LVDVLIEEWAIGPGGIEVGLVGRRGGCVATNRDDIVSTFYSSYVSIFFPIIEFELVSRVLSFHIGVASGRIIGGSIVDRGTSLLLVTFLGLVVLVLYDIVGCEV